MTRILVTQTIKLVATTRRWAQACSEEAAAPSLTIRASAWPKLLVQHAFRNMEVKSQEMLGQKVKEEPSKVSKLTRQITMMEAETMSQPSFCRSKRSMMETSMGKASKKTMAMRISTMTKVASACTTTAAQNTWTMSTLLEAPTIRNSNHSLYN